MYRPHNYLYKLTEKQAPDGYRTDTDWAHYFIWTSDSTSDDVAYKTAVGSYGESNTGVAKVTSMSTRVALPLIWK